MKKTYEVANVLLQNGRSEILLLQRSPRLKRGYMWGLPGGLIDAGENAHQAGLRELYEETGIREADITTAGLRRFLVEMPDENVRITSIRAALLDDVATIKLEKDEHIAYRWTPPAELFASRDLLPCMPTMVAESLQSQASFVDLTITPGTRLTLL